MAEMVACDECGVMVAEMSMAIHRAHACRGVARPAASSTREDDEAEKETPKEEIKKDNDDDDVIDLCDDSPSSRKRQDEAPSSPPPRRRQRRGRPKRDDTEDMEIDDIDAGDDDEDEVEVVKASEVVDLLNDDDDDEWPCTRCTLLNDKSKSTCEACGWKNPSIAVSANNNNSSNPDGVRAADPVRRERLIDDYGFDNYHPYASGNSANSPLSVVSGGAILGGLIGATGAYMRGRSMASGAFEGGVAGAVSGALLNEVIRSPDRNGSSNGRRETSNSSRRGRDYESSTDNLSRARSAGANGLPAYPVMGTGATRRSSRQPRASFRVASVESPEGFRSTIVTTSGGGDGPTRIIRRSQHSHRDQFHSLMLHSMMGDLGGSRNSAARAAAAMGGAGGVDNMSYEQLLSTFGDGSENLGADVMTISALPTAKVTTRADGTVDLPKDSCECSICLENFEEGHIRKTLPCLHGFHGICVDKWLNTNAACPVCKFRVDERGASS